MWKEGKEINSSLLQNYLESEVRDAIDEAKSNIDITKSARYVRELGVAEPTMRCI